MGVQARAGASAFVEGIGAVMPGLLARPHKPIKRESKLIDVIAR